MSSPFDHPRIYGYRQLQEMDKVSKCRMSIADNMRRATFNPTGTDAFIVASFVVACLGLLLLLAF